MVVTLITHQCGDGWCTAAEAEDDTEHDRGDVRIYSVTKT